MFKKIPISNRGEIACRIIWTEVPMGVTLGRRLVSA